MFPEGIKTSQGWSPDEGHHSVILYSWKDDHFRYVKDFTHLLTFLTHLRNVCQILILLLQGWLILFSLFISVCLITVPFLYNFLFMAWSLKMQTLSISKYWSLWSSWQCLWCWTANWHSCLLYCSEISWGWLCKLGNHFLIKLLGAIAGGIAYSVCIHEIEHAIYKIIWQGEAWPIYSGNGSCCS